MYYYYYLMKFNISSRIHQFNRNQLNKSWERHINDRRKLRIISEKENFFQKMRKIMNISKS